jgi:hypothetical protein
MRALVEDFLGSSDNIIPLSALLTNILVSTLGRSRWRFTAPTNPPARLGPTRDQAGYSVVGSRSFGESAWKMIPPGNV